MGSLASSRQTYVISLYPIRIGDKGILMDKDAALRRIGAIEQMLCDLRNDIAADDGPAEEGVTVSERQGVWKRSDLEALLPLIEHLPGALALLDVTAEHAPHAVTYRDVLDRSGLSDQEQRNDHTRLSWATKKLFPEGKRWPLDWQRRAPPCPLARCNTGCLPRSPAGRSIRQREQPDSAA